MKTCSYCGRDNEDAAVICTGCGTKEFEGTAAQPRPLVFLSNSTIIVLSLVLGLLTLPAGLFIWSVVVGDLDSTPDGMDIARVSWCLFVLGSVIFCLFRAFSPWEAEGYGARGVGCGDNADLHN